MKNYQTILCIILGIIIITTACHHEESINNGTTVNTNCESIQITARYAMSHQPASKTLITPVNNNPQYGLSVLWAKNDLICLVQSANGTEQARELLLTEGAGQTTATFTGKGFETSEEGAENLTYQAFYPATKGGGTAEEWKKNATYGGQIQQGYDNALHLANYDYLSTPEVKTLSEDLQFSHIGMIFCFDITMPESTPAIPLSLTLTTLDENRSPIATGGLYQDCNNTPTPSLTLHFAQCTEAVPQFKAYLISNCNIPAGQQLRLTLALEDGNSYSHEMTAARAIPDAATEEYSAGTSYVVPVSEWTKESNSVYNKTTSAKEPTGNGSAEDPYIIENAEHLKYITGNPSSMLDKHFLLAADITIADGVEWKPIGTSTEAFTGSFNGNGHVIKGVLTPPTNSSTNSYFGFFGNTKGATISNLTIQADIAESPYITGSIVGSAYNTTISNCHYKGNITYTTTDYMGTRYMGGIAGKLEKESIAMNCSAQGCLASDGNEITNAWHTGGIVGHLTEGSTVAGCINYMEIKNQTTFKQNIYTGGIVGGMLGTTTTPSTIKECRNYGKITGGEISATNYITSTGGIIGYANYCTIIDVTNEAEITVPATKGKCYTGGIIGYQNQNCSLLRALNKGNVNGYAANGKYESHTGGLTGCLRAATCTIHQSRNEGNVSVTTPGSANNESAYTGSYAGYAIDSKLAFPCCSTAESVTVRDKEAQTVESTSPAYYTGNAETLETNTCGELHQPLQ